MKRFTYLTLSLGLLSGVVSCGSEKEEPQPTVTKTELISNKDWMVSSLTLSTGGQTLDISEYIDDCEKDNILRFAVNKTYVISEGAIVCSPSGAENGTWAFNTEETKLTRTPQGGTAETFNIVELTDSSLKLSGSFLDDQTTATLTFKKK